MTETRKIAAILVSDVVGYGRLVGADEDRTLARLRALRSDMIDPTIAVHHGRVVKRTGDGAVVEFRSVIDAVRCALEVQSGMVERNAGLPPERRIEFRIGIHLGDVVEESDGDLIGDGVNIAARLEAICEVGGVCISEDAYRQVRDKIRERFVDLGEQALKNIARPMRAYQVKPGETKAEAAAVEAPSAQLALPDKPSLAVLPERYDRELTDIFTLQDEIVQHVVGAIEPRLFAAEGVRSQNRPPADLDAWDMVARAMSGYWRLTGPDVEAAIAMLKDAAARYPHYAPAHSMLGFCLVLAGHWGWLPMFEVPRLALDSALRAVNLDESDPWAYLALGYVACVERRTDDAVADFHKAIELNPNFAAAHGFLGFPLAFDGRSEDAVATLSRAMRLSPQDRLNTLLMAAMAVAHYTARRYDQAIEWSRKGVQQGPTLAGHHRILCASLAQAGHIDAARATLARLRELQPHISLEWAENMVPYTPAQMPHFLEGLKKAGLT